MFLKDNLPISQALMTERQGLSAWTSANNPGLMDKLMTSRLDGSPAPDHDRPAHFWQRILVHNAANLVYNYNDVETLCLKNLD